MQDIRSLCGMLPPNFHGHHAAILWVVFASGFDSVPDDYFPVFKSKQVPGRGYEMTK